MDSFCSSSFWRKENKEEEQELKEEKATVTTLSAPASVFSWSQELSSSDGGGASGRTSGKEDEEMMELMFDKVLTPSDVGKLNRLVIPKCHAEKHFPLDPAAKDEGIELSVEERAGERWTTGTAARATS